MVIHTGSWRKRTIIGQWSWDHENLGSRSWDHGNPRIMITRSWKSYYHDHGIMEISENSTIMVMGSWLFRLCDHRFMILFAFCKIMVTGSWLFVFWDHGIIEIPGSWPWDHEVGSWGIITLDHHEPWWMTMKSYLCVFLKFTL